MDSFWFSTSESECNSESEEMPATKPFVAFDVWLLCKSEETKVHSKFSGRQLQMISENIRILDTNIHCNFNLKKEEFNDAHKLQLTLDTKVSLFSDQMV